MSKQKSPLVFSQVVLRWFDQHGRHHLPWQQAISPYRVWVSEIMLQQTQVNTVIPYFTRFIQTFPTLDALAKAHEDAVLHVWTGLGYYRRARHLHAAAQHIATQLDGVFPDTLATLCQLPGIGRSTAGAILSIAFKQRASILDGNVKRVLARYHAVEGWPGQSAVAQRLWHYAEQHPPQRRCADYNQAMMDLGATVCTRSQPQCQCCPLAAHCIAFAQQATDRYPVKKPAKTLPIKTAQLLIIENPQGEILLQKRPPTGVWAGLWSFPDVPHDTDYQSYCQQHFNTAVSEAQHLDKRRHTFSHYHLDMCPLHIKLTTQPLCVTENQHCWYNSDKPAAIGLPAPIKRYLYTLTGACEQ